MKRLAIDAVLENGGDSHGGWRLKPRLRDAREHPQSLPAQAAERTPPGRLVGSTLCNPRRRVSWRARSPRPFRRGLNRQPL